MIAGDNDLLNRDPLNPRSHSSLLQDINNESPAGNSMRAHRNNQVIAGAKSGPDEERTEDEGDSASSPIPPIPPTLPTPSGPSISRLYSIEEYEGEDDLSPSLRKILRNQKRTRDQLIMQRNEISTLVKSVNRLKRAIVDIHTFMRVKNMCYVDISFSDPFKVCVFIADGYSCTFNR